MKLPDNPILKRFINRNQSTFRQFFSLAGFISIILFIIVAAGLSPDLYMNIDNQVIQLSTFVLLIVAVSLIMGSILFVRREANEPANDLLTLTNIPLSRLAVGYVWAIMWSQRWIIVAGMWSVGVLRLFILINMERNRKLSLQAPFSFPLPDIPSIDQLILQFLLSGILGLALAFLIVSGTIIAQLKRKHNVVLAALVTFVGTFPVAMGAILFSNVIVDEESFIGFILSLLAIIILFGLGIWLSGRQRQSYEQITKSLTKISTTFFSYVLWLVVFGLIPSILFSVVGRELPSWYDDEGVLLAAGILLTGHVMRKILLTRRSVNIISWIIVFGWLSIFMFINIYVLLFGDDNKIVVGIFAWTYRLSIPIIIAGLGFINLENTDRIDPTRKRTAKQGLTVG